MKTNIIIHVLPGEIDWFERIVESLLRNASYLPEVESKNVIIDATLNLSKELYDTSLFQIPASYFTDRWELLSRKLDQAYITNLTIETGSATLGINDKRRNSIRKYASEVDNFIYLDNDVTFPDTALYYLLSYAKLLKDSNLQYFIITPEITKFWDDSWDIITNNRYRHLPYNFRDTYNTAQLYNTTQCEDINLFENTSNTKLGGGWLNLFSSKLLSFVDIPDSLGPYGEDDTYVMIAADIMRSFGIEAKQYIVQNLIVSEEGKFRQKVYDKYLPSIRNNQEVRQQANINLPTELQKFKQKCHDYVLHTK